MKTRVVNLRYHNKFDVYIGRRKGTNEHFGNPFVIGIDGNREDVVAKFEDWYDGKKYQYVEPERRKWILENINRLRGKILGCFCPPELCHGDIYIKKLGG